MINIYIRPYGTFLHKSTNPLKEQNDSDIDSYSFSNLKKSKSDFIEHSVDWFFNELFYDNNSKELNENSKISKIFIIVDSESQKEHCKSLIHSSSSYKYLTNLISDYLLIDNFSSNNNNSNNILITTKNHKDEKILSSINFDICFYVTDLQQLNITSIKNTFNKNVFNYEENNSSINNNSSNNLKLINSSFNKNYDYIFETLPQLKFIFKNILDKYRCNKNKLDLRETTKDYFKNSKKILYLLEQHILEKNYRKREITLPCDKCLYIPLNYFLNLSNNKKELVELLRNYFKSNSLNMNNNDYWDCYLQRCPELFMQHPDEAFELEKILYIIGIKQIVDPSNILIKYYDRSSQVLNLSSITKKYNDMLKANPKYKSLKESSNNKIENLKDIVTLEFPKSIITNLYKIAVEEDKSIFNLKYPIIIKPSFCGNHKMKILSNKDSLNNYVTNLKKEINELKDQYEDDKKDTIIVQEIVPHEPLLLKIYYINNDSRIVVRSSISEDEYGKGSEIVEFTTDDIYNKSTKNFTLGENNNVSESQNKLLNDYSKKLLTYVDTIKKMTEFIHQETKLSLLNVDYVLSNTGEMFIIEVNYFPSYHEYQEELKPVFDKFLIDTIEKSNKEYGKLKDN